ncbi:MAG: InlB B-repeat-containing protein, partial [Treponema sp.]|nr:InlB B-repeat-containing protein [Treponema sp.]
MKKGVLAIAFAVLLSGCADLFVDNNTVAFQEPAPPEFTVKIDTATGGAVAITPQKPTYKPKERVKLTAAAESGYEFKGWSGTVDSAENPLLLTVTDDIWIIPQFEKKAVPPAYQIRVDEAAGGTVTIDPKKTTYAPEEQIKLAALPDPGYVFTGWTGTIRSNENPLLLIAHANHWIIPEFWKEAEIPAYRIRVDTVSGGTVSVDPEKTAYEPNEQVKISATPAAGYIFTGWTGTVTGTANPLLLTATTHSWLIPQFEKLADPVVYTVKVDTAEGGTVSVEPQKADYIPNEQVKLTAAPNAGYVFKGWTGTVSSAANPLLLTVTANTWIIPQFEKLAEAPAYTVKVDTALGGTISVDPQKNTYAPNEQVKLTAAPNAGYMFKGWTGTISSAANPLLLTITANVWIIPQFEEQVTYTLLTDWSPLGGSITSSTGNKTTFLAGEKCAIKAVPAAGYQFDGWEGDIETTADTIYITFNKDYQVFPRFTKIPESVS